MKIYDLLYLLDKQPASLKKTDTFKILSYNLKNSKVLNNIKLNRKTYSALNNARVDSSKLGLFLKNNNLPESNFFPDFMALKYKYLKEKKRLRAEKIDEINKILIQIKPIYKKYIRLVVNQEKRFAKNKHPVFNSFVFPKSVKRAEKLLSFDSFDWFILLSEYLTRLRVKYQIKDDNSLNNTLNLMIFHIYPDGQQPDNDHCLKMFRKLSKHCHPDTGGNPEKFKILLNARTILRF